MKKQQYTNRAGLTRFKPVMTLAAMERRMFGLSNDGWCLACGSTTGPLEPDARKAPCECCGESSAYGFEELMMMGLIKFV